jgi:O-antigen/teichoic acid export membrane protein
MNSAAVGHRLVFVGGVRRSGASRVTSMLGYHKLVSTIRVNGSPSVEDELLQQVFDTAAAHGGPDKWAFSREMHLTDASPVCTPASAEKLWQSWGPHWDLSKQVLVERSAPNLLRARFLQGVFPGASFIMVMRHPIAVAEAGGKGPAASRLARVEHWVTAYETMNEDLPHLDRVLIVRYEDLVAHAEREYRRMLEFLELPWAPSVVDLGLGGNEPYYQSWTSGSVIARISSHRAAREYGDRVGHFDYLLRPPYALRSPRLRSPMTRAPSDLEMIRSEVSPPETTPGPAASIDSAAPAGSGSGSGAITEQARSRGELSSAARGGFAFSAGIVVAAIFQFVFLTLAAHTLDQSAIGALLEAIAIFTILTNTAELGADTGLLRFSTVFRRRRPQDIGRLHVVALVPALVASVLTAVLMFAFAPQLVHLFVHHVVHKGASTSVRILAFFLPAVTLTTVICAGLRAWTLRVPVLVNSFILPISRPVIFAGFLVIGVTTELASIAWAAPTAVLFAIVAIVLVSKIRRTTADRKEPVTPYREIAREFWRFSLPRTFGAILQVVILSLDVLLVGMFLSAKQAAAYSVASRYLLYGTFALAAISASVAPQLSRLIDARNYTALNIVYKSATWWTILASWPALLVLAIFAPLFMSIFGHGYLTASSALTILSLAMLTNTGTGPNGPLLQMGGRTGIILGIQAVGLAINVGLNVWLIPRIGLRGAAIAWLACIAFIAFVTAAFVWRDFRAAPFGGGFAISTGAALGCYGVLGLATRLAFGTGPAAFVIYAIVASALYGFVLFKWRSALNLDAFESVWRGVFRKVRKLHIRLTGRGPAHGRARHRRTPASAGSKT